MATAGERRVVLYPQTLVGAGTTTSANPIDVSGYTSAILVLNVPTINTGTTLDVYVQQELPIAAAGDTAFGAVPTGTAVWDDFAHFTQVTTSTGVWVIRVTGGSNVGAAQKDAALSAGTVASGPIGSNWRVKAVSVGTAYTFSVTAILIP